MSPEADAGLGAPELRAIAKSVTGMARLVDLVSAMRLAYLRITAAKQRFEG
jgi:hypothetical protein